jgi:arylformamidase
MVYDLSVPINNKTITYPADPVVSVTRVVDFDEYGYNVSNISFGTHSGTHVDVPLHFIKDGADAASIDLGRFFGTALVFEVPYEERKAIRFADIDTSKICKDDIVIIRTGWEQKAGTPGFFKEYPYFDPDSIEKLLNIGIKALGTDLPSVDRPETNGTTHRKILSNNVMIIEALVNLKPLVGKRCFFSAVPLKIEQGDGSPVRAYAVI